MLNEMDQLIDGKVVDRQTTQSNDDQAGQMELI
jgi:hypothetical protein